MTVLLISYGDYDYDGRLRELFCVAEKLGNVCAYTRGSREKNNNHILINTNYLKFIHDVCSKAKRHNNIDVIMLDNRKSVIPGLLLKKHFKNAKIILDCRELYLSRYVKGFSSKIGCIIEKKGIYKADVIVCANDARACFMKDYYKLSKKPIVYENLRKLEYSNSVNFSKLKNRFDSHFCDDEIRIISTSGCDISRTNDILIKNLNKIHYNVRVFLVGKSSENDINKIQKIISENKLNNVEIIDQLNQDELKYLISNCHIGIVNYHQKDINNKFCASGKLFEFIYEGLPVVTTTNPPLKCFCEQFGIGRCSDDYSDAIDYVIDNFESIKQNVLNFSKSHDVSTNNIGFYNELLLKLKEEE